jgi:hypothetical protein
MLGQEAASLDWIWSPRAKKWRYGIWNEHDCGIDASHEGPTCRHAWSFDPHPRDGATRISLAIAIIDPLEAPPLLNLPHEPPTAPR